MNEKILLLARETDPDARAVAAALERRGVRPIRFNARDFPLRATVELSVDRDEASPWAVVSQDGWRLAEGEARAVWYRRPDRCDVGDDASELESAVAEAECAETLRSLCRAISGLWVNRPEKSLLAGSKLAQLQRAKELGLRVPRTLVSNDPERLRRFRDENAGLIVIKSQRAVRLPVEAGLSALAEATRSCPIMAQERVPAELELRATVIGSRVFASSLPTSERFALPSDIERGLLMLARGFGLQYAAVDLLVTPRGEFVFVELDPDGTFGWVEALTGQRLADAVAELLVSGRPE